MAGPGPWLNITTLSAINPGPRDCYGLAYDAADHYVVLFAGCVPFGTNGDTWTYSHGVWTQLQIIGPSNRTYFSMTYDGADNYVLLYGGLVSGNALNDTWGFHAGAWTKIITKVSPKPRTLASLAYDAQDKYVVLFGGYGNSFNVLRDTWSYKAGNWTAYTWVNTSAYPSARTSAGMEYDPVNHSVVLFGGLNNNKGTFYTDTWTFAAGNWTHENTTMTPPGREVPAEAYDPILGHLLMFGGDSLAGGLKDMWAWIPGSSGFGNWTQLNATVTPSKRTLADLVWDTADGYGVLYGGAPSYSSRAYLSDTWTLGLNLTSSLTVTPPNIDIGEATTFRAAAVANNSSYFNFTYVGLPRGCSSANSTGITCTPTVTGAFNVNVTVRDSQGRRVNSNTTLHIWNGPVISAFTVLPAAITLGQTINFSTNAAGGVGTLKYSYSGLPSLPSGCINRNLPTFTCVPRTPANYSLLVTVTDSLGGHNNTTSLLVVNRDPVVGGFAPVTSQIDIGQTATFNTNASFGTGALTYVYVGLPGGCTPVNSPTVSCKPTQTGTFFVNVTVTDTVGYNATRETSITINADPVISAYVIAPKAIDFGQASTFNVNASLGTGSLTYSFAGLPRGCPNVNQSFFGCTPAATGNYTVVVTVSDLASWTVTATATLTVRADPGIASFISTPSQLDLGQALVLQANLTGGSGGFTYSYSGLPGGCVPVNSPTVNCTPTSTGAFVVHLTIHDSAGKSAAGTTSISIAPDLVFVSFSISPARIDPGTNTTFNVLVRAGTGSHTFVYSGLPTGCTTTNSPSFFCLPSEPGRFNVTVQVTDAANFMVTGNATLFVNQSASSGPGGNSGSSSFPVLDLEILGLVIALVVVAAVVLLLRRRSPPTSEGAVSEDDTEEGAASEELYGAEAAGSGEESSEAMAEPTLEPPAEEEPLPEESD